MAATSDGRLLGRELKPKFNALYDKVLAHRRNRQRQELRTDSPRLSALERRLTGMVKTMAGQCANKLVREYPNYVFVIEDLNLRGCRGSKRFAFKAIHHSLTTKAPTSEVNCAFTSQQCPSCGYLSRKNRNGIKFRCRGCGRLSHADVVGCARTFRGQTHPSRRSLHPRWSHPERAIPGMPPGQFLRCAHYRARTVEPGAHRGLFMSPHSLKPGRSQMDVLSDHGLGNGGLSVLEDESILARHDRSTGSIGQHDSIHNRALDSVTSWLLLRRILTVCDPRVDSTGHGYQEAQVPQARRVQRLVDPFGKGTGHRSSASHAGDVRVGHGRRPGARDARAPSVFAARQQAQEFPQGLSSQPPLSRPPSRVATRRGSHCCDLRRDVFSGLNADLRGRASAYGGD
jgi:Putative transposase DNA-binding domain